MKLFKAQYADLTDAELLENYKATENIQLLTELFFRYTNLISGTCLKYLKDHEAAKDAVLNIYEELVQKTKVYEIKCFKSWIYSVTRNYCVTFLKKNKHQIIELQDDSAIVWDDFSRLDKLLEKENLFALLEQCLKKLSKDQSVTIRLFYLENKCYNEIAAVTGHEWNKIRSLVQNGKRNLKICMEAV